MITSAQIRSARAALRISSQDLAEMSGVALRTIKRLENADGIPSSHTSTLASVKAALEAAGIEFIGTPADRPGIRLASSTARKSGPGRLPGDAD